MKKLIAYSSVAHMGFVTIGIFTVTPEAVQGAMIQMLSHGVVSAALFLCVGVVYDRLHTREIARYGGLVDHMPRYALCLHGVHAGLGRPAGHQRLRRRVPVAARRLPGQHLGRVPRRPPASFLGAAYMLYLYRRVDLRRRSPATTCAPCSIFSRARSRCSRR